MQSQLIMEELRLLEQRRRQQELLLQQLSSLMPAVAGRYASSLSGSLASKYPLSSALLNSFSELRATSGLPIAVQGPAPAGSSTSSDDARLLCGLQDRIRAASGANSLLTGAGQNPLNAPRLSPTASAPVTGTGTSLTGLPQNPGLISQAAGLLQSKSTTSNISPLTSTFNADSLRKLEGQKAAAAAAAAAAPASISFFPRADELCISSTVKRDRNPQDRDPNDLPSSQPWKKRKFPSDSKDPGSFPQMGKNSTKKIALDSFRKMWDNVNVTSQEMKKEIFLRLLHKGKTPFSTDATNKMSQKKSNEGIPVKLAVNSSPTAHMHAQADGQAGDCGAV